MSTPTAAGPSQKRSPLFIKISAKNQTPKNQSNVPKWSPQGAPNAGQNRQNPSKSRPGELPLSSYQKQDRKSKISEPVWEGETWLKCMSILKKHTFQLWARGRQKVSEMSPKSFLFRAILAPKSKQMPSTKASKKTSKNRLPKTTKM